MEIQVDAQDLINALSAQRNAMADAAATSAAALEKVARENAALKAKIAELEPKKE